MIDALGVRLRLRCDRDLDRAKRDWARCAAQGTDDVGPEVLGHGARALETAVTARLITESTGKLHLWHAAGVSLPDGRVLVLVAPSGTGKTTAAVRLSQSGWGYVTDETVGVTMDGRVLPYPKPVALLEDGVKEVVGPDDLGLAHHAENLTLGRVVVLERTEDAQSPSLTRLPLLEGLQTLLAQSSGLVQLPEPLASTCRLIDRVGGIYRLTYAELASAAPLLRALMAKCPDAVETWLHRPPLATGSEERTGDLGHVVRAPWLDAIGCSDEVLLLVGSLTLRLSGIGASIWTALDRPRSMDELVTLVSHDHGPHPDAVTLVERAIDEMESAGVVTRVAVTNPAPL